MYLLFMPQLVLYNLMVVINGPEVGCIKTTDRNSSPPIREVQFVTVVSDLS